MRLRFRLNVELRNINTPQSSLLIPPCEKFSDDDSIRSMAGDYIESVLYQRGLGASVAV